MNHHEEHRYLRNSWHNKIGKNHLLVLLVIVFALAITFLVALIVILCQRTKNESVCLTPGCIHAASMVLTKLDKSTDPCEDFYQFACGAYIKNNNIPDDEIGIDSFSLVDKVVIEQLKLIIEELKEKDVKRPYSILKDIYDTCMNISALESQGLKVFNGILEELGGWPLLKGAKWNEDTFDWKESMYKLRKLGFSPSRFIKFSVGTDKKNSSRRIINIDQAPLVLSMKFLQKGFEEKIVKDYYNYMVDAAVLFGAKHSTASKDVNDTLKFQMALANISLPQEERRNASLLYNPMSVKEIQNKFSYIPWLEYLNNILNNPEIEITEDEVVNLAVPKYLGDLKNLLEQTPRRIQANSIITSIVFSVMDKLPQKFRDRAREYFNTAYGRKEQPARWKTCVVAASTSAPFAISALYLKKYFNEEDKNLAKEMINSVRNVFLETLRTNDWMDDQTKEAAIDKAKAIYTHIGYADELLDAEKIESYYSDLKIGSNGYLKSVLSVSLFDINKALKQLRQPINKTDWKNLALPIAVNAFYSSFKNNIQIPAGILQGIFFNKDRPRYMNYGAIGWTIGHEITHGFDDGGRQYDKNGNLAKWWTESTKEIFMKKAQCIIDQYSNYTVPEVQINLNGINTQGENIADNGGIKHAYLAYQDWVEQNGKEQKLPGLPYTPNQMFWISAAHKWCSKYTDEYLKRSVITGVHSPARYRIIGSFSNMKYFSEAFDCPLGSKMNPVHKCQVW